MNKAALRIAYKKKRQQLSNTEIQELSEQIAHRLIDLIAQANPIIHLFLPIKRFNEIDTFLVREIIDQQIPGCNWIISKSNFSDGSLEHFQFDQYTKIKESSFGIPEPLNGEPADLSKVTTVLVPLLAFDKHGNRLGYGKGFYDRFLSECPETCIKIGLSFFEPVEQVLPVDTWDIPLDICITPQEVHYFKD